MTSMMEQEAAHSAEMGFEVADAHAARADATGIAGTLDLLVGESDAARAWRLACHASEPEAAPALAVQREMLYRPPGLKWQMDASPVVAKGEFGDDAVSSDRSRRGSTASAISIPSTASFGPTEAIALPAGWPHPAPGRAAGPPAYDHFYCKFTDL